MFFGLPLKLLQKLWQVQNESAQLLLNKGVREVAKPPSVNCIACQFDKKRFRTRSLFSVLRLGSLTTKEEEKLLYIPEGLCSFNFSYQHRLL